MIQQCVAQLLEHRDLGADQVRAVVEAIMEGQCSDIHIAAFLVALRAKGETAEEIAGAALAMREKVTRVRVDRRPVLDVVGTGGDRQGTFNISTGAALVAAAAGAVVAKHGNRGVSSSSGSADVLQALGVDIEADVPVIEACVREAGIGFCFAPRLHRAMKHVMPVRRALAVPTVFNVLGPLTNPAGAECQLLGVGNPALVERMAQALVRLGTRHTFVIHSEDGLDEVSLSAPTDVWEVRAGQVRRLRWTAADFGLPECRLDDLKVGGVAESAATITAVLEGQRGPARDAVVANAAAGLLAADLAASLPEAAARAADAIDSGRARATLQRLVQISHGRP